MRRSATGGTKERRSDGQRAFNRMQAGLRALVEQAIGQLASAWALRRRRGLLYRVRDVFGLLAPWFALAAGSTRSPPERASRTPSLARDPRRWESGGASGELRAARTMAVTSAARPARPRRWPGVAAWTLWALAMLGIPVPVWLDRLLRQAGRSDLLQLVPEAIPATLVLVSATTVGAVVASRRPAHPVGWLLLSLGLSIAAGGVAASYVA